MAYEPIPEAVELCSREIIGAAIEVHRHLGPGFLESVYERALVHELQLRGLTVDRQVPVTLQYKDLDIDGQRLDLIVQPGVIVEIKAVSALLPVHQAQLMSYLKATDLRLGLLINFHEQVLKNGIKRVIL